VEAPIRVKQLGDMPPEMPAAQTSPKSHKFSSEAVLGILSSFPRQAMNIKIGDNFVAHNLDTKFALFGVRTWEIWCWQGRAANQKNLDKAEFMKTKLTSIPRKISCKAWWNMSRDFSKGINTTPRRPRGCYHSHPTILPTPFTRKPPFPCY
jgi:hypothetical protein